MINLVPFEGSVTEVLPWFGSRPDEMDLLERVSVKAANFKCFGDSQGFERILPINVIIGRNNSGKSSLLDFIASVSDNVEFQSEQFHQGRQSERVHTCVLDTEMNDWAFSTRIGDSSLGDYWKFIREQCPGAKVEWAYSKAGVTPLSFEDPVKGRQRNLESVKRLIQEVGKRVGSPFSGYVFRPDFI